MESKRLGSKFLWMNIMRAKKGTNSFLSKFSWEEILGRKFWRSRFFWEKSFASKIFGGFLRVNFHSGEEIILGSKNVLEMKDMVSKTF